MQLLAVAKSALEGLPGVLAACIEDLESIVGQVEVGTERLNTAHNNLHQAVGIETVAGGGIVNLNAQLEKAIDETHAALNTFNNAQVAYAAAMRAVDDLITKVRAAPNN